VTLPALRKVYGMKGAEARWYTVWLQRGALSCQGNKKRGDAFSIVVSLPDVTGPYIRDIRLIIRFKRS
jgi:valyl-tRNA synthetase